MSCTVEERKRVRRAARAIQEEVPTESVDVLSPSASQYGEWTLDAVLRDTKGARQRCFESRVGRADVAADA